jgi:predicted Fe-S protein YdhL (DUF1289 family)
MDDPPSPCTGVCRIEPGTGWCAGCRRNLGEIAVWQALTASEKRAVLDSLPGRK